MSWNLHQLLETTKKEKKKEKVSFSCAVVMDSSYRGYRKLHEINKRGAN